MIPLLLSWALSVGQVQTVYWTQTNFPLPIFPYGASAEDPRHAVEQPRDQSGWQTPNGSFDVAVSAKALILGHLELSGALDSIQSFAGTEEGFVPSFSPSYIRYDIGIAGIFGPVKAGFAHWCGHTVVANPYSLPNELISAGSTRFYIEVSGSATIGQN